MISSLMLRWAVAFIQMKLPVVEQVSWSVPIMVAFTMMFWRLSTSFWRKLATPNHFQKQE
jgi:hypothetical protein